MRTYLISSILMLLFCNCTRNSLLTPKYTKGSHFAHSYKTRANHQLQTIEASPPQSSSKNIPNKEHNKFASSNGSAGNYIVSGISLVITTAVLFVIAKLFGIAFPYVVAGVIVLIVAAIVFLVRSHLN